MRRLFDLRARNDDGQVAVEGMLEVVTTVVARHTGRRRIHQLG
jgi:hypothetical protein